MEYEIKLEEQQDWLERVYQKIVRKMEWVREKSKDKIPYLTIDGVHDDRSERASGQAADDGICWWTNGFWAGLLWQKVSERS